MQDEKRTVRVYYVPQSFPCGPQSSCCGPVGQSMEEISALKAEVEAAAPGITVETIDVTQPMSPSRDGAVVRVLRSFGAQACPVIAVGSEIISMGPPSHDELMALIRSKVEVPEDTGTG